MGNATSSLEANQPPRKTSHKLSKPRVGRHASTSAGLLSSNGLAPSTTRRSNSHDTGTGGGLPPRPSPPSILLSSPPSPLVSDLASVDLVPGSPDQHSRRRPYSTIGYKSSKRSSIILPSESPQERPRRASISLTSPQEYNPLRRVHSTADGFTDRPIHPNCMTESWRASYNGPYAVDVHSEHHQSTRSLYPREFANMHHHEPVVSEHKYAILENTWKNSHPTPQPPTSPRLSRTKSDISIYAPVRRRSLIRTPGIATRSPSVSDLAKRSSTKPAPATRHSRRTSIDPGPELISVPTRVLGSGENRAVTPNDIDYRQLGAMQFGSLRITNRTPSPSSGRKRGKDGSAPGGSDLKNGRDSSLNAGSKRETATGPKIADPRPTSTTLAHITATFLKLESSDSGQPSMTAQDEEERLAAFLPGLNFGSFSLITSKPEPSDLQTTSKHTAVEDDLFEEDTLSTSPQDDGADAQNAVDNQHRSNRGRRDLNTKAIQSATRPDSGLVSSPISETAHKPFSKTDSGYSSNVSLRSLRNSKGSVMDKELPPCPGESSKYPEVDRTRSATSFLGEVRLPSPRMISLEGRPVPAPPDREAPPPPLPPKDIHLMTRAVSSAAANPATAVLLDAPITRTKTKSKKKPTPRPSFLLTSRHRAPGPGSPNSIQLSPAFSNVSSSGSIHRAAVQKPGALKRLLSVASRKGSRSSLVSRSFRNSGSTSTSRDSTGTPIPFLAKPTKDSRHGVGSGLSAMESADTVEPSQGADSRHESSEEAMVRRRRSFQSIPTTIINAAVSILPSRGSLRRSESWRVEETANTEQPEEETTEETTEENEGWSRISSSESDVASTEDYTHDSLMRNGFDPSFMAMTSARDAYFSDAPSRAPSRAGSVVSRAPSVASRAASVASRSDDVRLAALKARSNAGSPASFNTTTTSQSTNIFDQPYMSASHPLMRTRSVTQLRVPAPLRPHSTPSQLHRSQSQTLTRQSSREHIFSYPPTVASARPSIDSAMSPPDTQHLPQPPPMTPQGKEDLASLDELEQHQWPPRGPGSHSRTNSASSSQASSYGPYVRSMSANPYSEQQRQIPRRPSTANPYPDMPGQGPQLRHRASYEAQGSSKSRGSQAYRRQSPNLWTSTHYEQLQMQYGGMPFGPQAGGWNPPHVPRSGHYRNRSTASQFQGKSNAPYRVLHSYYSPAYRHAPIWG